MTKPLTRAQLDRYEREATRQFRRWLKQQRKDLHDMLDQELDRETGGVSGIHQVMAAVSIDGCQVQVIVGLVHPTDIEDQATKSGIKVVKA